jgi:hypothetical protein
MAGESEPKLTIRSIVFGRHAAARTLNPSFASDSRLVRVRVDIAAGPRPAQAFRRASAALLRACPSLARHRCAGNSGAGFLDGSGNGQDDLAHLLEHVVIDLEARLSSLEQISGVTCGHVAPSSRYDIFVECDGRRPTEFVVRLAAWALGQSANDGAPLPRLAAVARAFASVEKRPALLADVDALAHAARLPHTQAGAVLRLVRRFRPAARIA